MTGNSPFDRSAFLQGLAEELDPPRGQQQLSRERYEDLGEWLHDHAAKTAGRDVQVYPQGSANLGTTNRDPFTGELDIDLVIRVAYGKWELTQKQLNQLINGWLGSYVWTRQQAGHRLAPTKLEQGKRAWTLHYADGFHMDVLPVVPDLADELNASMGDASWLTDKALVVLGSADPAEPLGEPPRDQHCRARPAQGGGGQEGQGRHRQAAQRPSQDHPAGNCPAVQAPPRLHVPQ